MFFVVVVVSLHSFSALLLNSIKHNLSLSFIKSNKTIKAYFTFFFLAPLIEPELSITQTKSILGLFSKEFIIYSASFLLFSEVVSRVLTEIMTGIYYSTLELN